MVLTKLLSKLDNLWYNITDTPSPVIRSTHKSLFDLKTQLKSNLVTD